jgi:uncharacterized protein
MTTPPAPPPQPPPPSGQPPGDEPHGDQPGDEPHGDQPGDGPHGSPADDGPHGSPADDGPHGSPAQGASPPPPPPAPPPAWGTPPAHPAGGPGVTTSSDERNWAVAAHLTALIGFAGIPSFVGPLIVWLIKREQPFVDEHGKEALNFNLSVLIYLIVGGVVLTIVAIVTLGLGLIILIPALVAVFIAWLVFVIQAAGRASRGELYRYPLTIRLIT